MGLTGRGVNALLARAGGWGTLSGMRTAPAAGLPDGLRPLEPVHVFDRLMPLHAELMGLLRTLGPDDWHRPTACALWSVRDITAHLLDDDLRRLSFHRDGQPPPVTGPLSDRALVEFVNAMNAEWVAVARRMSPRVLVDLLEVTGPWIVELFRSTDPFAPAHWAVTWAGDSVSPHWLDVGRDYTERWLHQQQIRDAVGAPPLTARYWLHPVLSLFVRGLPPAYRAVQAPVGTSVMVSIEGDAGGIWTLRHEADGWRLLAGSVPAAAATVTMSDDTAWRLFTKGLAPDAARRLVHLDGDQALAAPALGALAILG
jgi:uncharacterized protein (TIGR03083 family)